MNTESHADRSHSTWSASATARNINCPGAIALIASLNKPERTSEAADWGTCAHQIAEACMNDWSLQPESFIGKTVKGKAYEFEVDEEMAETASVFVTYVYDRMHKYAKETGDVARLWIEQNFSLEKLKPPFDAGGTADAVIWFSKWRMLEVVDLKGGRGVVVEVKKNGQARSYSLGAVLAHPDLKPETIRSTIVQPRAPHKDGRIRSEEIHISELIEWSADLVAAMRASKSASEAFSMIGTTNTSRGGVTRTVQDWSAEWLNAGDHCKFCPAASACPAIEKKAMDEVGLWFDEWEQPRMANAPTELSPERLAQILDAADMIEEWLNAVRAEAHGQAEAGISIPNYTLVQKQGRRKWKEADELAIMNNLMAIGLAQDKIVNVKVKSPAQIETVLGKKRKEEIKDLWETPVTGTNLVRADKTTRASVTPSVHQHFNKIE